MPPFPYLREHLGDSHGIVTKSLSPQGKGLFCHNLEDIASKEI